MSVRITIEANPVEEYRGDPVHGVFDFDPANKGDMIALEMMHIQLGQVEDKESAEEWDVDEDAFEHACRRMAGIMGLMEKARLMQSR